MKVLRMIGLAIVAVLMSVSISACGDDDDDEAGGTTGANSLVGTTWMESVDYNSPELLVLKFTSTTKVQRQIYLSDEKRYTSEGSYDYVFDAKANTGHFRRVNEDNFDEEYEFVVSGTVMNLTKTTTPPAEFTSVKPYTTDYVMVKQ